MKTLQLTLAALALAGAATASEPAATPGGDEVLPLDLRALYVERGGTLALAPAIEALRGKHVRVRGFMVQLEEPLRGAFYVAAHPVEQDESGGGTGDLPVASLLVKVPALAGAEVPWRPNPVEVVGTLQIGREEELDGRVSALRVVLVDPPARR